MTKIYEADLMDRVLDKLDKLDDKIDGVDKTLVKQQANLEEHMLRSAANERAVEELKNKITPVLIQFNMAVKIIILLLSSGVVWKLVQLFVK